MNELKEGIDALAEKRIRYIVEYTKWGDQQMRYPKFFESLGNALQYTNQLRKDFGEKRYKYRIVKETVTSEVVHKGENYAASE